MNSEKDESGEHPVKKERLVSPPHMATVPGLASDKSDSESVILIRGTQVSKTQQPVAVKKKNGLEPIASAHQV